MVATLQSANYTVFSGIDIRGSVTEGGNTTRLSLLTGFSFKGKVAARRGIIEYSDVTLKLQFIFTEPHVSPTVGLDVTYKFDFDDEYGRHTDIKFTGFRTLESEASMEVSDVTLRVDYILSGGSGRLVNDRAHPNSNV